MKANRGLTIERMVELGRVSRSGFYRFDGSAEPPPDLHMDLRHAIQRIALEWPSYGRPRITAELRRQDWTVNPNRARSEVRPTPHRSGPMLTAASDFGFAETGAM